MTENKILPTDASERLPYEAPAIEESATFERMRLECARQEGEFSCEEIGGPANS